MTPTMISMSALLAMIIILTFICWHLANRLDELDDRLTAQSFNNAATAQMLVAHLLGEDVDIHFMKLRTTEEE